MITEEQRLLELEHARQQVREWQATVEVLEDPETVRQLNEAEADIAAGNLVPAESIREIMEARRSE